jgi:hypothetical protein
LIDRCGLIRRSPNEQALIGEDLATSTQSLRTPCGGSAFTAVEALADPAVRSRFADLEFDQFHHIFPKARLKGSYSGQSDNTSIGAAWVFVQPLQVTPTADVTASGMQGGPFSPSSFSYRHRWFQPATKFMNPSVDRE